VDYHDATRSRWSFSASHLLLKDSRSTPVKHLPLFNRVRQSEPCCRGPLTSGLLQAPQSADRIGCLAASAAATDRRSFGARRPHVSRSQQHTARAESPGARCPAASRDRQESAEQGHGISTRERRVRRIQEAETITGRVRREANPLADATRMYATKSNAHQERSGRDKKRQKSAPKGLTIVATEKGYQQRVDQLRGPWMDSNPMSANG